MYHLKTRRTMTIVTVVGISRFTVYSYMQVL